jgi:hypothetical protein
MYRQRIELQSPSPNYLGQSLLHHHLVGGWPTININKPNKPYLVGGLNPLKNMKITWDDDILYRWKVIKFMFQTTNQSCMTVAICSDDIFFRLQRREYHSPGFMRHPSQCKKLQVGLVRSSIFFVVAVVSTWTKACLNLAGPNVS